MAACREFVERRCWTDREILLEMAVRMGARLMLRPGLALYGYLDRLTLDGLSWDPEPGFAPVLPWKTQVTSLRTLQAGETVGYGRTFVAERETRLALLPVGYADGYNRLLSNRGHVLVRGHQSSDCGAGFNGPDGGGCYEQYVALCHTLQRLQRLALVSKEKTGSGITSDIDIGPTVIVKVGSHHGETVSRAHIIDSCRGAHVSKRSVAIVGVQRVASIRQPARSAEHFLNVELETSPARGTAFGSNRR